LGGTISAWNMSVVGSSASSTIAFRTSSEETAGNSSTYNACEHTILITYYHDADNQGTAINLPRCR
jgi:hypothetical protein